MAFNRWWFTYLWYGAYCRKERGLEVDEYARGYVSIGDDGGGNVFLMAQHAEEKEVVVIDSGDMNPSHATVITTEF